MLMPVSGNLPRGCSRFSFPRIAGCRRQIGSNQYGRGSQGRATAYLPQERGFGGAETPVRHCERSEEHTSELQSHLNLVCRLLLEKKKKMKYTILPSQNRILYTTLVT